LRHMREHRGEYRAGKIALRTAPGLPVRVNYRVDVLEVVVLEEELREERIFPNGFRLLVLPILRFLTAEELT
jgi:hypothetical protein